MRNASNVRAVTVAQVRKARRLADDCDLKIAGIARSMKVSRSSLIRGLKMTDQQIDDEVERGLMFK